MERKYLLLLGAICLAIIAALVNSLQGSQNKDCASAGDQAARDDCYHALGHSTNNKTLCNNIADAEEKEHCFGQIPE